MNIKQFLVIKACQTLPSDVCSIIWSYIEKDAIDILRNMYYLKVLRNLDFFLILLKLSSENNGYSYEYVNRMINFYKDKITYTCIQEPGTWIDYLNDIIYIYKNRFFHINNVMYMINKITICNEIYRNTRMTWWENM